MSVRLHNINILNCFVTPEFEIIPKVNAQDNDVKYYAVQYLIFQDLRIMFENDLDPFYFEIIRIISFEGLSLISFYKKKNMFFLNI